MATRAERLVGAVRRAGAGVALPGLKKRRREGLLWRNEEEGMGPGERGVRVLQGGCRKNCWGGC